jgi:hypothetical protein
LLAQLGAAGSEGVILMADYRPESAMYTQFMQDMTTAHGAEAPGLVSHDAARAWLSVQILAAALKGGPTVDRASTLANLQVLRFDTSGMVARPLDYAQRVPDPAILNGKAPNLLLHSALGAEMQGGVLKSADDRWQDAFAGPPSGAGG